jgi:hypothetical protein
MILILTIIIGIVAFLVDTYKNPNFKNCNKSFAFCFLHLFHHIIVTFLVLGIFTLNINIAKVYSGVIIVILLSWFVYKNHCLLTYHTNKLCNLPVETPHVNLIDYVFSYFSGKPINLSKDRPPTDYYLLTFLFAVSLLKIGYLSKKNKI